jgi:inosose dehydratase
VGVQTENEGELVIDLANAPVSWGVDFADQPGAPPWSTVLDGIRDAGYGRVELGPFGYLPVDHQILRTELDERGLSAAGGLLYEPFHRPSARDKILSLTNAVSRWIANVGGSYLVLVPMVDEPRSAWAGRADRAPSLSRDERRAMHELFGELAARAEDAGLDCVVHPHAGTYVETRAEIDAAMRDDRMRLCIDTGHCAYSGIDLETLLADYGERTAGFHLKDVGGVQRDHAVAAELDFDDAVTAGIFCPLGEGLVDFAALARHVHRLDVRPWGTVEQDIDPRRPADPVAHAAASRGFLRSAGLVA